MSICEGRDGDMHLRPLMPKTSCPPLPNEEARIDGNSQVKPQPHGDCALLLCKQRNPQGALYFLGDWIWEGAGIIISGVIMIAIIVILRKYDQNKQPEWTHISLNSLVSWLSTLSKACLLFSVSQAIGQLKWVWFTRRSRPLNDLDTFDSASRGVLGSAALLWLTKGRDIAVLGSLATILTLGFDPFIQNLIHYAPRSVDDPSEVSLLAGAPHYNTVGPLSGGDTFYVDPTLKANVYNALFNVDPSQPWAVPQYTCPTGNCTWDPMTTLGIHAMCTNITSDLQSDCATNNCTLSLDSGTALWYLRSGGAARPMVINTISQNSGSVYRNSSFPVVQYILAVGSNDDPTTGGGISTEIGNSTQFAATECALQPYVRSFEASVIMGVYKEKELAKWTVINDSVSVDQNYRIALTPDWNRSYGMQEGQVYGIGYEAWSAITVFLTELFAGYVAVASDSFSFQRSTQGGTYATTDALEAIFYNKFNETNCQNNDQLTCALGQVAAAMSKTFRDTAFTSDLNFQPGGFTSVNTTAGHTKIVVSFVFVHWEWLVLPAAAWVLGALFCISSAWSTHGAQIQTWMNSTLPLALPLLTGSENRSISESGIPSRQSSDSSGAGRYYRLPCSDGSLKEHIQSAKRVRAKLERNIGSESKDNQ